MSATGVEELLTTQEAEQVAEVAVEPEAIAAAPAEVAPAPASEVPAIQTTPEAAKPTASEQAYDTEMSAEDRDSLIRTADYRIGQTLAPFTLAVSNRRAELRQHAKNPKLIATLGKMAFGELLPGITRGNPMAGVGLPEQASALVSKTALKPATMKKSLEKINKIPMLNFNVNYPALLESDTDEDFVDTLSVNAMTANEAIRVGLEGRSNEDLASLCAAFDGKANSVSVFEDHIDMALSKITIEPPDQKEEEIEKKVEEKQIAAAGDDPEARQKLQVEKPSEQVAETETGPAKQEKSTEEQQVLETMPDEMKDLYDDRSYNQRA
ncbi:MAG: hypothetical protein H0T79_00780 [Deltaproteobacteria bacterium]|nr:hypothetical protein [Deltaproteobacteria bacterium]